MPQESKVALPSGFWSYLIKGRNKLKIQILRKEYLRYLFKSILSSCRTTILAVSMTAALVQLHKVTASTCHFRPRDSNGFIFFPALKSLHLLNSLQLSLWVCKLFLSGILINTQFLRVNQRASFQGVIIYFSWHSHPAKKGQIQILSG